MIDDLIRQTRSTRRFVQSEPVSTETLRALVNLARLSPSASNKQPLKYILCHTPEQNAIIFGHVGWAGYLTDWPGPAEGERPAAYIVILGDCHVTEAIDCDHGIAAQSILLGARERGLGGCILGSIKRGPLRSALGPGRPLPDHAGDRAGQTGRSKSCWRTSGRRAASSTGATRTASTTSRNAAWTKSL